MNIEEEDNEREYVSIGDIVVMQEEYKNDTTQFQEYEVIGINRFDLIIIDDVEEEHWIDKRLFKKKKGAFCGF